MDAERLSRWKETFRNYMLAYYYELPASTLARRWDRWGSGISFVIALTSLNVRSHIKKRRLLRKQFSKIRNALQTVLFDIVAGQDLSKIDGELRIQRTRYFALTASFDPDMAETAGLRQRVKSDRDIVLHELGFFAQGTIEEAKDGEPKDDDNDGPSAARE